MSEQEFEMIPVKKEYLCNECHEGFMRPTGIMLASNPPQWPHICNHCGHGETFRKSYPQIVYKDKP